MAGIHEQGPGSRRNWRLGSSSSSHVKAATRTARARWFPSDAGGSPSLAAVRQALLTSSEHRRAAGPWSASTQRAVVAEPSEQARFHTTDLDVDVPRRLRTLPLPCWMLRDPPAPGSRDPLPSRVKVYRAVGMRGPSAGTDCNGRAASVSWRFCTREVERDRPRTRDRGRFVPIHDGLAVLRAGPVRSARRSFSGTHFLAEAFRQDRTAHSPALWAVLLCCAVSRDGRTRQVARTWRPSSSWPGRAARRGRLEHRATPDSNSKTLRAHGHEGGRPARNRIRLRRWASSTRTCSSSMISRRKPLACGTPDKRRDNCRVARRCGRDEESDQHVVPEVPTMTTHGRAGPR